MGCCRASGCGARAPASPALPASSPCGSSSPFPRSVPPCRILQAAAPLSSPPLPPPPPPPPHAPRTHPRTHPCAALRGPSCPAGSGFYGPDGAYPFAGRECARALAKFSTEVAGGGGRVGCGGASTFLLWRGGGRAADFVSTTTVLILLPLLLVRRLDRRPHRLLAGRAGLAARLAGPAVQQVQNRGGGGQAVRGRCCSWGERVSQPTRGLRRPSAAACVSAARQGCAACRPVVYCSLALCKCMLRSAEAVPAPEARAAAAPAKCGAERRRAAAVAALCLAAQHGSSQQRSAAAARLPPRLQFRLSLPHYAHNQNQAARLHKASRFKWRAGRQRWEGRACGERVQAG